jgi:hypothetical protein
MLLQKDLFPKSLQKRRFQKLNFKLRKSELPLIIKAPFNEKQT